MIAVGMLALLGSVAFFLMRGNFPAGPNGPIKEILGPKTQVRILRDPWEGTTTETSSYEDQMGRLVKHGPEIVRYANGQKKSEVPYSHGQRDGVAITWYPHGERETARHFKNGQPDGQSTEWFENGEVRSEVNYRNGRLHGKQTYWDPGRKLRKQEEYKDGIPHGAWIIVDDSGRREDGKYIDGQKDGVWTTYYENGRKLEEGQYVGGKATGTWSRWHDNGTLEAQGAFRNDQQDGLWKFWHSNGTLASEQEFKNGTLFGFAKSWDAQGQLQPVLRKIETGSARAVRSVSFTGDGALAAMSVGEERTSSVFCLRMHSAEYLKAVPSLDGTAVCSQLHPLDGNYVFASQDRTVKLWNLQNGALISSFQHPTVPTINYMAVARSPALLAVGGPSRSVSIWNYAQNEFLLSLNLPAEVTCLAISPDGKILAAGSRYGRFASHVRLFETGSWSSVKEFQLSIGSPGSIGFDPAVKWMLIGGGNGLSVISLDSGDELFRKQTTNYFYTAYWPSAVSPDGAIFAYCFTYRPQITDEYKARLCVCDMKTGAVRREIEVSQYFDSMAFSPDGRFLISTASYPAGITVWDVEALAQP